MNNYDGRDGGYNNENNFTNNKMGEAADAPPSSNPLAHISLKKLLQNDATECQRLFAAVRDVGFFYLDLRDAELGEQALADAESMFSVGRDFFYLPEEEKEKYDMNKFGGHFGYKGYLNRTLDVKEFYAVSKDDILSVPPPTPTTTDPGEDSPLSYQKRILQPTPITAARSLIASHIHNSHSIISILLGHLTQLLHLPSGTLEGVHRLHARSGDQVRWIKIQANTTPTTPPSTPAAEHIVLDEHCDSNSLTLLFNHSGGLQVRIPRPQTRYDAGTSESDSLADFDAGSEEPDDNRRDEAGASRWVCAAPVPGHCAILVGEQMANLLHGHLRSSVHRVCLPTPEPSTGSSTRYSLVYFCRLEDDVVLKQLAGMTVIPFAPEILTDNDVLPQQVHGKRSLLQWARNKRLLGRSLDGK
ncbi:hypothetical protein AJ80_02911 [Polytolypa hystricis UAMH7299]|uniref:Fe2OG dioxygenase domain-containing protein n=1 Tax=Polytolypa hystricis (strain UAMH7299) TaxID=1447883 RepID=A0A2B7YN07_POLH7|nr:hypothetical protein AJ80_02911 [Polytolypa hystricis UAMH7299]